MKEEQKIKDGCWINIPSAVVRGIQKDLGPFGISSIDYINSLEYPEFICCEYGENNRTAFLGGVKFSSGKQDSVRVCLSRKLSSDIQGMVEYIKSYHPNTCGGISFIDVFGAWMATMSVYSRCTCASWGMSSCVWFSLDMISSFNCLARYSKDYFEPPLNITRVGVSPTIEEVSYSSALAKAIAVEPEVVSVNTHTFDGRICTMHHLNQQSWYSEGYMSANSIYRRLAYERRRI